MKVIGTFSKVLKNDGLLLLKPEFKDSDFLSDFNYLYHFDLKTKWIITSITKVPKGFQIRLKDVNTFKDASYFIGERFALPENEIFGLSQDLLIDMPVQDKSGSIIGKIAAFTPTPAYSLAELAMNGADPVFVPFTENFFELKEGKIILLRME